jgi:hypothetical protein
MHGCYAGSHLHEILPNEECYVEVGMWPFLVLLGQCFVRWGRARRPLDMYYNWPSFDAFSLQLLKNFLHTSSRDSLKNVSNSLSCMPLSTNS